MRYLLTIGLIAVFVSVSACRGSIDERANSELTIRNAATDEFISDGDDWGTIDLAPGATLQLEVTRRTDHAQGDFEVVDVTNQVSYDVKTAGVATISAAGLVTAMAAGNSEVVVEFDDGDTDTTDNDISRLFINVVAP